MENGTVSRLQIVELNAAELARAADCARRRNRIDVPPSKDNVRRGRAIEASAAGANSLLYNEIGAQGEIVVAKLLGIRAPLHVDTFHTWPDVPPNWNVKTQMSTSKDMREGYLRLSAGDFQRDYRHVLVERDTALDGHYVFVVHGWIGNDEAEIVARKRYAYSTNRHVHIKHLQPIEPMCQLDEEYWAERAARWYFDDAGELRMHGEIDKPETDAA
jgi:hypothetical protein